MSAETIADKYRAIAETFGSEAESFTRKILGIFAKGRGRDFALWGAVLDLYKNGSIVPYTEDLPLDRIKDSILFKHGDGIVEWDFNVNSAFGYVNSDNTAIFAEVPLSLYDWDGSVTSLTTSILELGRAYHHQQVSDPEKHWAANNAPTMVGALLVANRLSVYIQRENNESS